MNTLTPTSRTQNGSDTKETKRGSVQIQPPNFKVAEFHIQGTAPLVIHRFSHKLMLEMKQKMEAGKSASSKKKRDPVDTDEKYNEARYTSKEGWDGFHAASIRKGMVECCRLVNFKMTLAKMSVFVIADGWDAKEPTIPLIRIYGTPEKFESLGRVETGQPYVTIRALYKEWEAKLKIRWDADQFSLEDITNLLARVGVQNGLGEGRPNSKNSTGCEWGTFKLIQK